MKGQLKAQHEAIKADFEALKSAVEAARQEKGKGGFQPGAHRPIGA
jgi:outer membrane murein-binding lipoprotein Lpp